MSIGATIDAMLAAGCSAEQLAAVVRDHQARLDKQAAEAEVRIADRLLEKKRLAAERQRKWRLAHPKNNESNALPRVTEGDSALSSVSNGDSASNARAPAHEEVLTSLDSKNHPTKSPPKGGPKGKVSADSGTRFPEDFVPDETTIEVGLQAGHSRSYILGPGIDELRDYWAGIPGSKGRKLDWQGTYRNRLRATAPRKPPARAGPNGHRPRTMTELARMEFSDEPSASPQTEPESPEPADPTILGFAGRLSQPDRDQPGGKLLDLGQVGARWRA